MLLKVGRKGGNSFEKEVNSSTGRQKFRKAYVNILDRRTERPRSRRDRQRKRRDSMTQEERAEERKGVGYMCIRDI